MTEIFAWICSILSLVMIWEMGNKSIRGPIIGILCNFAWFGFILSSEQHGLWVGAIGFIIIHIRNLYKWNRETRG